MALNNYILPMKDMFEPGNNTISYNLHDFTGIYIVTGNFLPPNLIP